MIEFDARKLTDVLVKVEAAADQLPRIAETARAEALAKAQIQARRNVYDTTPGVYERTETYLRGFRASRRVTRNTATVSVWNIADYAEVIETGTGPHEMTPAQIVAQAAPNPYAPLYFGRSGEKYSLPGPAVIPAAVFALYRMQELFAGEVKKALR